jgi:hypothetical protein
VQQKATEQPEGFAAAGVSGSRAPEEGQSVEGAGSMKIYLAARYSRREELLRYAHELEEFTNATVTSRWLQGEPDTDVNGDNSSHTIRHNMRFALKDFDDIAAADTFIAFTEEPNCGSTRGGRHVELGIALTLRKRILIVGPRENIFCCLAEVRAFDTWRDCLRAFIIEEYEPYGAEIESAV